jgi:hypothetical protein
MKRKNIIITALLVLSFGLMGINNANAQVFIMEDEEYDNMRNGNNMPEGFIVPLLPDHDSTLDWTPIGNGIWLLGCLGGAYLLSKRRKDRDE